MDCSIPREVAWSHCCLPGAQHGTGSSSAIEPASDSITDLRGTSGATDDGPTPDQNRTVETSGISSFHRRHSTVLGEDEGTVEESWDTDNDEEDGDTSPSVCECFRKPFYWAVKLPCFENTVNALIFLNTLLLASVYDGMSTAHEVSPHTRYVSCGPSMCLVCESVLWRSSYGCPTFSSSLLSCTFSSVWLQDFLRYAELCFVVFFTWEAIVKIVALGIWPGYFSHKSSLFDFTLVVFSITGLIIDSGIFGVLKIFRVLRIFRMLRSIKYVEMTLSLYDYLNLNLLVQSSTNTSSNLVNDWSCTSGIQCGYLSLNVPSAAHLTKCCAFYNQYRDLTRCCALNWAQRCLHQIVDSWLTFSVRQLRRIIDSALHSMKMVANVFLLLFLILCAYALIGKSLFGNLFVSQDCKTNVLTTCNYLGDYVPNNFDNFFRSILTLFAVMTFDGEFVNDLNSWTVCLLASIRFILEWKSPWICPPVLQNATHTHWVCFVCFITQNWHWATLLESHEWLSAV